MSEPAQYNRVLSWLNMGSFPGSVLFANGYSYEELIETLKRKRQGNWIKALKPSYELAKDHGNLTVFQEMEDDGSTYQYMFLLIRKPFDFSDEDYCTLAHECLHLCQFSLYKMLDRNKEFEAEAYTHTHLMKQCLTALRSKVTKEITIGLEGETGVLKIA